MIPDSKMADDTLLRKQYEEEGFAILRNFLRDDQVNALVMEMEKIIKGFGNLDELRRKSNPFTTNEQVRNSDDYFLTSGDVIRPFFEERADASVPSLLAINKVGVAFALRQIMNFQSPRPVQSMYIFKQKRVGGAVNEHVDSTFLITQPSTVAGIWIALQDSNESNGCLWVRPRSHLLKNKKFFHLSNDGLSTVMREEEKTAQEKAFLATLPAIACPVKKGDLIVFHGNLHHYSLDNYSDFTRHALSVHYVESSAHWVSRNWLRSRLSNIMPLYGAPSSRLVKPILIDISVLFEANEDSWERKKIAAEFDVAMKSCGFCVITGHCVDFSLIETLFRLARTFFLKEPMERKLKIKAKAYGASNGYNPPNVETVDAKSNVDVLESLYYSTISSPFVSQSNCDSREFQNAIEQYFDQMESFIHAVNVLASHSLGLDEGSFNKAYQSRQDGGSRTLKLSHYLPSKENKQNVIYGAHTDYEGWTFLQLDSKVDVDEENGVQVLVNGKWSPTIRSDEFPENSFLVNAGDFIEIFTQGRWKSNLHRVIGNKHRISIPFFTGPSLNQTVTSLLPPNHDAFSEYKENKTVNAKEYLMKRIAEGSISTPPSLSSL